MTKNIEDWRLTPGFVAFISIKGDSKKIWLCARDKKTYKTALKKEIPATTTVKELSPDLNEVELKFVRQENEWGDEPGVFIKNEEILPDDSWYQVMNFYEKHLVNFILDASPVKGEFPGQIFEAIFSETEPTKVSFISSDMSKYNTYFDEMKRRLNVELGKKSKKWVPGHRYDTLKESYYYLGSFLSRKSNETNSEFLKDPEMQTVYLYVNSIKAEEKNISDIFNSRNIGTGPEDIKVLRAIPSTFDAGDALKDDLGDDIRVYWNNMLDNAVEACKSPIDSYTSYVDTKKIFDIISIQSSGHLEYPKEIIQKIENILGKLCMDIVFLNYGLVHADKNLDINSIQDFDKNVKATIRNLYYKTRDTNVLRISYYSALWEALGINIDLIAEKSLIAFDEPSLSRDFDTFCNYSFYFDMRKPEHQITSRQRDKSALYKSEITTVEDILGIGELSGAIKKLFEYADNNFGIGVNTYNIYNVGTKSSPNEYTHCIITLNDLINFLGKDKLTDQIKKEILDYKFTRIAINADRSAKIK